MAWEVLPRRTLSPFSVCSQMSYVLPLCVGAEITSLKLARMCCSILSKILFCVAGEVILSSPLYFDWTFLMRGW